MSEQQWQEKTKNLLDYLNAAVQDQDLQIAALPKLDLYMDQVISLCQDEIGYFPKEEPIQPVLTKTMINNYSKEGLLLNIKGKKYSPAHILQMQLIYHLKQVLSINEIKKLFDALEQDLVEQETHCYQEEHVFALSQCFLQEKECIRQQLPQLLTDLILCHVPKEEKISDQGQKALQILALTTIADYARKTAMAMVADLAESETPGKKNKKQKQKAAE